MPSTYPTMKADLNLMVEHAGKTYEIHLEASVNRAGDLLEIDWDATDLVSCIDETGDDIEPGYVEGLWEVIQMQADAIDLSDHEG